MAILKVGVARVTITPPIGIPMWGFGNRAQPSQSIHDELTATALVLDDGATRLGIVAADVIALEDWHVAEIRAPGPPKPSAYRAIISSSRSVTPTPDP